MVTDYFFVDSYFFQIRTMKIQIIKKFWDMEIIGNRRKTLLLLLRLGFTSNSDCSAVWSNEDYTLGQRHQIQAY